MQTFWAHGYETTSIGDLTKTMGINAPALYSAFGSKSELFLEVMQLYRGDAAREAEAIDGAPSAREAAALVLRNAIATFTRADGPKGCLVGTGLASGSQAAAGIRLEGTAMRLALEKTLSARIQKDISAGILPAGTQAEALAAYVVCTVQGFSTLARDGAAAATLEQVARLVLASWPESVR